MTHSDAVDPGFDHGICRCRRREEYLWWWTRHILLCFEWLSGLA